MMLRRSVHLLAFLLISTVVSGLKSDSIFLSGLLIKGKALESRHQDSAMLIYNRILFLADSMDYINKDVADLAVHVAKYEYYRGNTEKAITLALHELGYYEQNSS